MKIDDKENKMKKRINFYTDTTKSLWSLFILLFTIFHFGCASTEDLMNRYDVPGISVAVVHNFRLVSTECYGFKNVERKEVVNTETLFQAASLSKPVTATAALSLVDDGIMELKENVNNQLNSWKLKENELTKKEPVTLEQLLSHSAGINVHGFRGYAQGEEIPNLIQILEGEAPANSDALRVEILPDTQYRYSGGGYCIVQQLLVDTKKKPFPELMRDTVLNPLQMTNSTFQQPLPEKWRTKVATGYRSNGTKVKGEYHTYPEMAAAGLWTTPSDLANFLIEIMKSWSGQTNKIMSKEMARDMLSERFNGYGLGFSVNDKRENIYFSHSGSNQGFESYMIGYPERGDGVIIMTNSDNGSKVYKAILQSIKWKYHWPGH
jgi:CubicO group peptidase (beta-lactamase class C family)